LHIDSQVSSDKRPLIPLLSKAKRSVADKETFLIASSAKAALSSVSSKESKRVLKPEVDNSSVLPFTASHPALIASCVVNCLFLI